MLSNFFSILLNWTVEESDLKQILLRINTVVLTIDQLQSQTYKK